jgi:hypothetical protein
MRIQIGFFTLLGLIFITLKLIGVITWSWWLVTLPLWFGWVVIAFLFLLGAAWTLAILALAVIMETIDTMRGR